MKIVLIGFGAVGKTIVEMLPKIQFIPRYLWQNLAIIEPNEILAEHRWLLNDFRWTHHQLALSPTNIRDKFLPLLENNDIVLDCSVNVDAIELMQCCSEKQCLYVNTSMENWQTPHPEHLDTDPLALVQRSLYERGLLARAKFIKPSVSLMSDFGCNPGIISLLTLRGMRDYAQHHENKQALALIANGEYAQAAKLLQLRLIHITEHDTQIPTHEPDPSVFANTWSVDGFVAECLDPVQIGFGTHEPEIGTKPDKGPQNVRILPVRGMDLCQWSFSPLRNQDGSKFRGYSIPHGESGTISHFLTCQNYRPSVSFVYRPCSTARQCVKTMREHGYKPPSKTHVFTLAELQSGADAVGALLLFENGSNWWSGTILDVEDVKKLGFRIASPTVVQVGISMLSALRWMLDHPSEGFLTPENVDVDEVLNRSIAYLGKVYSGPIAGLQCPVHFQDFLCDSRSHQRM